MGATLEQFDLTQEDYGGLQGKCHEALVLNRPDVIEGVHESMLEAGADVVETDTFQASRLKLEEWGLGEHTLEINRKAAEIARKAAGEEPLRRRLDRPDRPPARLRRPDARQDHASASCVEVFTEQASGLIEGGADLLIIETAQDILEVKAAVFGAREAFEETGQRLPIQTSVSLLPNGGKMLLGTDIQAVLTTLTALDVDVIGLNCSTGPEDMRDAIRYLGENSPAAGRTASRTPASRSRGPTARRSSPRSPSRWRTRCRSSSSATASRSSAAAAARRPTTSRRSSSASAAARPAPRPERRARSLSRR